MKTLTINKEKFVDHLTHFLAHDTIPFLEKIGRMDDVKKMKSIKRAGAWSQLKDIYSWRDLRDLRDLSDLRALRALRDLSDLSDLSDLRASYAKQLTLAYVYAGGKRFDLKVAHIDRVQLRAIDENKWGFDMSSFEEKNACKTTYCRAGGAVALSEQWELKEWLGWSNVGAMVYYVSTGHVPDFYTDNETALADMRKAAKS